MERKCGEWGRNAENGEEMRRMGKKCGEWGRNAANEEEMRRMGKKCGEWGRNAANGEEMRQMGKKCGEWIQRSIFEGPRVVPSLMAGDDGCFRLNTGAWIPAVGLGTWESEGEACTAAVECALKAGYRHIDCSHLYGNEVQVGQALSHVLSSGAIQRQDLFVTSKLWFTSNAPKNVATSIDASLKNLGVDYLDLLLVHCPIVAPLGDATDPPARQPLELREVTKHIKVIWLAMEELVKSSNKARAIGVSNFDVAMLKDILSFCTITPAVNQVEAHPFWRQEELLQYCKKTGIHVSAHSPLGVPGSNLVGCCSTDGEGSATRSLTRSLSAHGPLVMASLVENIAGGLGKSPAQILLRWGIQRGTSVLPRSLFPDRIESNIDVLNWSLPPDDWDAINSMEPQHRLVSSNYLYLSENAPLQLHTVEDI